MTTKDRLLIQVRHVEETHLGQREWWSNKRTVWAQVVPLSTEARAQYKQVAGQAHYSVRLKGSWNITQEGHRFKWVSGGGAFLVPTEPAAAPGVGRVTAVAARIDPDAIDIAVVLPFRGGWPGAFVPGEAVPGNQQLKQKELWLLGVHGVSTAT